MTTTTHARNGQKERILKALEDANGEWLSMPILSRIGSGNNLGWCASFTRRIFELRQDGWPIQMEEYRVDGKRLTKYRLVGSNLRELTL